MCGIMASACAALSGSSRTVPVHIVHSNVQCRGTLAPSLTRITDAAGLEALIGNKLATKPGNETHAPRFPATDTGFPATNTGFPATNTGFPATDTGFPATNTGKLFSIDMGEHPSAGYALALQRAIQAQGVLTIYVDWQEPSPNTMTAQVMTHPCLVVRLPPDVEKIRVVDQTGRTRMSSD
ncbi:MAG: protease complex subunit PrcB family protein [Candidatus Nitrotoga sp.]